jgi:hypothetical protein
MVRATPTLDGALREFRGLFGALTEESPVSLREGGVPNGN